MYDTEPLDEMERRNRRAPEVYNSPPSQSSGNQWWTPDTSGWNDGYGDPNDGIGSPESGYGEGGVDNPAYGGTDKPIKAKKEATSDHNVDMTGPKNPVGYPDEDPPPSFQPAADPVQGPSGPAITYKTNPITDEVTKILLARLNELKNPGDVLNDPIYQNAVRQHQLQMLRGAEKQRKALAERSAASGTRSSGGFNVNTRGIYENAGNEAASYASGLALNRLQAREAQLNEAIRMARAVGQDDIANQLELVRLQLQAELGRGDLNLRRDLGFSRLGFDYTDLIMKANQNAVISALGG